MEKYIYKEIKEYLINLIVLNKKIKNYKLPSENQLANLFHCSRICATKALDELEKERLIYKMKGKGAFIYNPTAISNSKKRLKIAFISQSFDSLFVNNIYNGIYNFAKQHDVDLILLMSYNNLEQEEKNVIYAKMLNCNGIILFPIDALNFNETILGLLTNSTPCIFVDRKLYGHNITSISSDHIEIGFLAAQYLAQKYKKLYMLTFNKMTQSVYDRKTGFKMAINQFNPFAEVKIEDCTDKNLFELLQSTFFDKSEKVGVFCNSQIVIKTIAILKKLGYNINEHYELVAIDEEIPYRNFYEENKIIPILQDGFNIGYNAIQSLYNFIVYKHPLKNIIIPLLKHPFSQNKTF